MAAKTSASRGKQTSSKGNAKVRKVMREYKRGQLKSGGKRQVKNRQQAVAIALNEARRSGAKVPPEKKSSAKRFVSRKSSGARRSTKRS